jgi:hypothetical protein
MSEHKKIGCPICPVSGLELILYIVNVHPPHLSFYNLPWFFLIRGQPATDGLIVCFRFHLRHTPVTRRALARSRTIEQTADRPLQYNSNFLLYRQQLNSTDISCQDHDNSKKATSIPCPHLRRRRTIRSWRLRA